MTTASRGVLGPPTLQASRFGEFPNYADHET